MEETNLKNKVVYSYKDIVFHTNNYITEDILRKCEFPFNFCNLIIRRIKETDLFPFGFIMDKNLYIFHFNGTVNNRCCSKIINLFNKEYTSIISYKVFFKKNILSIKNNNHIFKINENMDKEELKNILSKIENYEERSNRLIYKYKTLKCEYGKFNNYCLKCISKGELYFSKPSELNDPFECSYISKKYQINRIEDFRILSTTFVCNDVPMWSYYADQNRGICVGFPINEVFSKTIANYTTVVCGDVNYSNNQPNERFYDLYKIFLGKRTANVLFYLKICFTKSDKWEHENEYRFIGLNRMLYEEFNYSQQDKNDSNTIEVIPKELILGCKTNSYDKIIIQLFNFFKIELFKVVPKLRYRFVKEKII